MSEAHRNVVEGIIARTMRANGFHGSLRVISIRRNRKGYSARVVASLAGTEKAYKAVIVDRKVRVAAV